MDDTIEVDLLEIFKKYALLLILSTVVVGAAAFSLSYLLPNEYTASTSMYVLRQDQNGEAVAADQQEITLATSVANDVITIMKSERVAGDVAEQLGLESLKGYKLSVSSEANSRVVNLKVTGKDARMAAEVANAVVSDTAEVAVEAMNLKAINVIDVATAPTAPSGPNHLMIGLAGAVAGFALAFAYAFMRTTLDTRIRDGEEASRVVGAPVVGHFQTAQ